MSCTKRTRRVPRLAAIPLALLGAAAASACSTSAAAEGAPEPTAIVLAVDDVSTAEERLVLEGPIVSGTLAAAAHAVVRAEMGGAVTRTLVDAGSAVTIGTPLARIHDRAERVAHASALAAVHTERNGLAVARRRAERSATLLAAGAVSSEEVEEARQHVAVAEAALAAARAQLADITERLTHAVVRSPIAGIVSVRSVSDGEAVQSGAALFEVLDPSTMRLDAAVPAAQLGAVHVGAAVRFTITGYPGRSFTGRVDRVSPAADPATRQVPVRVTIDNRERRLVAGLFAEGRVTAAEQRVLVVPAAAVRGTSTRPEVLRLAGGRLQRVSVQAGAAAADEGTVVIVAGLARGDTVLVGGAPGIAPGSAARVAAASTPR